MTQSLADNPILKAIWRVLAFILGVLAPFLLLVTGAGVLYLGLINSLVPIMWTGGVLMLLAIGWLIFRFMALDSGFLFWD